MALLSFGLSDPFPPPGVTDTRRSDLGGSPLVRKTRSFALPPGLLAVGSEERQLLCTPQAAASTTPSSWGRRLRRESPVVPLFKGGPPRLSP